MVIRDHHIMQTKTAPIKLSGITPSQSILRCCLHTPSTSWHLNVQWYTSSLRKDAIIESSVNSFLVSLHPYLDIPIRPNHDRMKQNHLLTLFRRFVFRTHAHILVVIYYRGFNASKHSVLLKPLSSTLCIENRSLYIRRLALGNRCVFSCPRQSLVPLQTINAPYVFIAFLCIFLIFILILFCCSLPNATQNWKMSGKISNDPDLLFIFID